MWLQFQQQQKKITKVLIKAQQKESQRRSCDELERKWIWLTENRESWSSDWARIESVVHVLTRNINQHSEMYRPNFYESTCLRCKDIVYQVDRIGPLKDFTFFHSGCFKCKGCGTKLTLKTYFNNQHNHEDREVRIRMSNALINLYRAEAVTLTVKYKSLTTNAFFKSNWNFNIWKNIKILSLLLIWWLEFPIFSTGYIITSVTTNYNLHFIHDIHLILIANEI